MNVLVIGGAGYIGSHVAKALATSGFCPITLDDLSLGHKEAVLYGPLEVGRFEDTSFVQKIIEQYNPIAIFHFAALASVAESMQCPSLYYQHNVVGTFSLLEVIKNLKIPFLFSSTCAVFGIPNYLPIDENHPQKPINPYGNTKLAIEKMIQDYHKAYGLPYAILRYFNAAGASLDGQIGEHHHQENHLIPLILDVALQRKEYIEVYGEDYPTQDGTAIRDYVHVLDLAEAHIKALIYLLSKNKYLEINIGTGTGFSVKEVITRAEHVCNTTIRRKICSRRKGDPSCLIANSSLCKTMLNWQPQYSDLDTILSTAWKWHQHLHEKNDARK